MAAAPRIRPVSTALREIQRTKARPNRAGNICAAIGLVVVSDLRRIYRIQRWEFWLSMICLAGVAMFGAVPGIAIAIVIAVIGAVLVPGAKAPKLISNELVSRMKPGSVLVDIAIDQGGCFEDSRPTTHADPTFEVHNSVFYCVANMPGAVPNTSTYALTNVTLPYAVALADHGWKEACRRDPALALGLNTHAGTLTYKAVADAFGLPYTEASSILN